VRGAPSEVEWQRESNDSEWGQERVTQQYGLMGGADMMPPLVPRVKNAPRRIDHLIGTREV
jgi:hypothetical protein